jgi:hypothetical protein
VALAVGEGAAGVSHGVSVLSWPKDLASGAPSESSRLGRSVSLARRARDIRARRERRSVDELGQATKFERSPSGSIQMSLSPTGTVR